MIIDVDLFRSTKPNSLKRILCQCDDCGKRVMTRKQNIVMGRGTFTVCQPCAARRQGRRMKGYKHGEEHRRKTGLASKGRTHTEQVRKIISERHSGPKNHNWNPNREAVRRNEIARKACYVLLHGVLRRTKSKKLASSKDILGYSAIELLEHIDKQLLPGMTWVNRRDWHIDHIKPVHAFLAEGIVDPKVINALSNLRPRWAKENMAWRLEAVQ